MHGIRDRLGLSRYGLGILLLEVKPGLRGIALEKLIRAFGTNLHSSGRSRTIEQNVREVKDLIPAVHPRVAFNLAGARPVHRVSKTVGEAHWGGNRRSHASSSWYSGERDSIRRKASSSRRVTFRW